MMILSAGFWLVVTALAALALQAQGGNFPPMYRVHAFYYLWYTEPSAGGWTHWDHEVLPHWDAAVAAKHTHGVRFEPPDCLHSPYYPLRGPYSSTSRELIRQHLVEMEQYGIGVLVASWWGPPWRQGSHDTQMVNTDSRLEMVIRELEESGSKVRIAFHLEPYEGRTKETVHEDLVYLSKKYRDSPAVLQINGLPVYYVYDSYRLPASDWAQLLRRNDGPLNVRGTPADGFFLGLWLDRDDGDEDILPAGFDGFYTYFSRWAVSKDLLFVPSIGPGYHGGCPGNKKQSERPSRRETLDHDTTMLLYRALWSAALSAGVQMVSITSYNEWGEGTQIEPAVPRETRLGCQYLSYEPASPYLYLEITSEGSKRLGQLTAGGEGETCQATSAGGNGDDGGGVGDGGSDDIAEQ
ncbi:hypothetical protein VOLCADRAFT_99671 [Volvox carteri f. nagariensis]|uniref:Glycoprotein endo-alpha-1,2-mannosidase-like protein n=1 Tax=Volvox carteri f. nagariensis TaxID=3068 RepID=D8UIB9_VOLCA|nr:uncharacterized protein VOLCADRAFT_99671 [Volvox carteri f. nagariensis]EFJ40560.1 hypothetical protein VOLCADRAFT_99671 [Volvox carteri f. nagariensis]|eukprot:XP_002958410.1 hypothetical protein VOLCADRAFT_99671 [Volvox carteri f. nagariensis]